MTIRLLDPPLYEFVPQGHEERAKLAATLGISVEKLAKQVYAEVLAKYKMKTIPHMYGTMIEIPRGCLTADKIAETAEFFSYGTNDLTQMRKAKKKK